MTEMNWQPLRGIDPERLREARLQAHYAVQWLARFARAYAPPQPDDSHTSLGWIERAGAFITHPARDGFRLVLRLADLTLTLFRDDPGTELPTMSLNGRTNAEVRAWLVAELSLRGVDAGALDAPSPYAIPAHPIAAGAPYDAATHGDGLSELAAWYTNCAYLLTFDREAIRQLNVEASPLRGWPHHFDLATAISFPARTAGSTAHVGVGLEPGDDYYDEPYFYVTVHPTPDATELPTLPAIGHWHTQDFVGAIATSRKILASRDPQAETEDFLRVALESAIGLLR
jgi:hypothetical protein